MEIEMALNVEKLNALSYIDYLNRMKEDVERLRYGGSDSAYSTANEIIWHVIDRYISESNLTRENYREQENGVSLWHVTDDLESNYNTKGKEAAINQFKEDLQTTLDRLINDLNKTGKK